MSVRLSLFDNHPRILRMCVTLEIDDCDLIIGKVQRVWAAAHRHTRRGFWANVSEEFVNRIVGMPGFAQAMVEVGWLEFKDGGAQLVNWTEHNATTVKERLAASARKRKSRMSRSGHNNVTECHTQMSRSECDTSHHGVTTQSPQETRDKRQEEEEEKKGADGLLLLSDTTKTDPEKQTTTTTKKTTRFAVPTVDEVAAYCRERSNTIDPMKFVDYYTAKGWMIGKNPMKDWRAAVRTWERNDAQQSAGFKQPPQPELTSEEILKRAHEQTEINRRNGSL
jgi:hypothetical protein